MDGAPTVASGFLFVGDQHLSSRPPERRKDADYAATVLGKMEQAITIANDNDLVALLLGDLWDRPKETDESLKTRLKRILTRARHLPVEVPGNHEMSGFTLQDKDSLAAIAEGGRTLLVPRKAGPVAEYILGGMRVGLGATPFGQEIPREVRGLFPEAKDTVWLTHADIGFNGAYPGSIPPFEIGGCGLVVNGHMHNYTPIVMAGRTAWFNPGSLTRTKIDQIAEEPSVWAFRPGSAEALERFKLRFDDDVFDLTGRLVEAEDSTVGLTGGSLFADGLEAEMEMDTSAPVTASGALIDEELASQFLVESVGAGAQAAILDLKRRVRDRREAQE